MFTNFTLKKWNNFKYRWMENWRYGMNSCHCVYREVAINMPILSIATYEVDVAEYVLPSCQVPKDTCNGEENYLLVA